MEESARGGRLLRAGVVSRERGGGDALLR